MRGKEKCKALKEIRKKIAEENDIAFVTSECTYQGECKGTCPKCEAELKYLERQLEARKKLGKVAIVAGISAGICTSLTGCEIRESIKDFLEEKFETTEMSGAVEAFPSTTEALSGDVPSTTEALSGDVPSTTETYEGGLEEFDPDEITTEYELSGDVEMLPEGDTTEEDTTEE